MSVFQDFQDFWTTRHLESPDFLEIFKFLLTTIENVKHATVTSTSKIKIQDLRFKIQDSRM